MPTRALRLSGGRSLYRFMAVVAVGGVLSFAAVPAAAAPAPPDAGWVKPDAAFGFAAEALAAIGLLGAVAVAAIAAERRRRDRAGAAAVDDPSEGVDREGAAVVDEPIGSIEYSPPSDPPG